MTHPTIGIIGGSGLYDMAELTDREERSITTPFGAPSGPYILGTLRGTRVAFLARHGAGHRILPSELNFRANIYGFKVLGVERILSASAVGSLKEEYRPLDIVVPDQFFDRTKGRISTFFGHGIVAHIAFAHPVCGELSKIAAACAQSVGRPSIFDALGVPALPVVGHGHHRDDEPAGSQTRPRGRDLLRDTRARHRLRLLAP
jgi:5'-methylthioadenosine phosphorylase